MKKRIIAIIDYLLGLDVMKLQIKELQASLEHERKAILSLSNTNNDLWVKIHDFRHNSNVDVDILADQIETLRQQTAASVKALAYKSEHPKVKVVKVRGTDCYIINYVADKPTHFCVGIKSTKKGSVAMLETIKTGKKSEVKLSKPKI